MSNSPIITKIDVKKINKNWLFVGAKGTYLDAVIYQNDSTDAYGNDFCIKQNPPKEDRENGAKPIIIGNGKFMKSRQQQQPAPQPPEDDGGEIPW